MSHERRSARKLWSARLLPHIFILPIASFIPFLLYAMQLSFSSFLMICTFNHYISHMRELHLHDVLVVLICRGILPTQEVPYSLQYILSFSFFFFLMNLSTSEINIFLPFFYRFQSHLINQSFNPSIFSYKYYVANFFNLHH